MPGSFPQVTLPNGRTVSCLRKLEAKFLAGEMPSYFQHDISVRAGDIVFDVGANIGLFSLWVYDHFGPDVAIYAFEPVPSIFQVLELNIRTLPSITVKPLPFGLSRVRNTVEFTYYPDEPGWSSASQYRPGYWLEFQHTAMKEGILRWRQNLGYPLLRWLPASVRPRVLRVLVDVSMNRRATRISRTAETIQCEVRTVSDVMREHGIPRIDLLKVDVEGAEMDVLAGIDERDWQNIGQVVAELDIHSESARPVSQLLHDHGFQTIELEQSIYQRDADTGLLFARR